MLYSLKYVNKIFTFGNTTNATLGFPDDLVKAYKVFDEIWDECVLLKLDIKENVDFSLSDNDEIKRAIINSR